MRPRASIQRAAPYVHQLRTVSSVAASTAPRARGSSGGVALTRRPSQAAVGRHASAPMVATATRAAAARRSGGAPCGGAPAAAPPPPPPRPARDPKPGGGPRPRPPAPPLAATTPPAHLP